MNESNENPDTARRFEQLGHQAQVVAHDVANWLSVAVGHLSIAAADPSEATPERLQRVRAALENCRELNERVLRFARGDSDQMPILPKLDASKILRGAFADLEALARGRSALRLTQRIAEPLWVEASDTDLANVIENLVANALDATSEGDRIHLSAAVDGPTVLLVVSDTGSGMDAATLARCQEPHFTTKGSAGNGLGLAEVVSRIESLGGTVQIESSPGQGTRVELRLPGATPESRDLARRPVGPRSVLLVEDDPAVQEVLREMCRLDGFTVEVAATGQLAQQRFADQPTDVVVLDLGLPDVDGLEVAKRIRQIRPAVGIVLLSGHIDALEIGEAGVVDFGCTKPIAFESFREILRRAHDLYRRRTNGPAQATE